MFVRIAIALMIVLAQAIGCGSDDSNGQQQKQQAAGRVEASQSSNIFPEVNFAPIQFKARKRKPSKDAQQAIAALQEMKTLYDWQNIPAALNQDLSFEKVRQYVEAWKLVHDQMPQDIEWLKGLTAKTLAGVDSISVQKIENQRKVQLDWLENRLPDQLNRSAKHTRQYLEGCVAPMMWGHIKKAADCDMKDSTQVANLLARPQLNETRAESIKKIALAYQALEFFDSELGVETDWASTKKEFQNVVIRYESKLAQAADAILPPADIGNAELAKIAEKVLNDKKYNLPKSVRIIVNAPKRSFGKDHFTIDFGERSIEKSPYRWEEFQVATIEQDGDQFALWYNTIVKYSEGPHTVPMEKWVLGPRHMSALITKANIDK